MNYSSKVCFSYELFNEVYFGNELFTLSVLVMDSSN